MSIYAAYGSNMHPEQMLSRAPHSPVAGTGWLDGWRLAFAGEDIGWDGSLATIVEEPGSRVFVVLYDVPDEDESALDQWEGTELDLHYKVRVRVTPTAAADQPPSHRRKKTTMPTRQMGSLPDPLFEPVLAWLYVVKAFEGGLPSARYLGMIAEAAEIAGAPSSYVRDLRTRAARNVGPGADI